MIELYTSVKEACLASGNPIPVIGAVKFDNVVADGNGV